MKVILPASMLIIIASLLAQCSLSTEESKPQSSSNATGSPSPSKDSGNEGLPAIPYEKMMEMIAGISKQAGIINLREADLSDSETEIRIWKAFGLAYPRCFILKFQKDTSHAFLVAPKVMGGKAVSDRKGEPIYVKTVLKPPRSGWGEIINYLKEQGIDSSVNLSLDTTDEPDPDEEFIIVELKKGSQYSLVYYLEFTESNDGKKALSICRRMEDEFGIRIGCGS